MRVRALGQENSLETETATDSSVLAWRIPWIEEPVFGPHSLVGWALGQNKSLDSESADGHVFTTSLTI